MIGSTFGFQQRMAARDRAKYLQALVPLQPDFRGLLDRLSPELVRVLREYDTESRSKGVIEYLERVLTRKTDPRFMPGSAQQLYEGHLTDYECRSTIARIAVKIQAEEQRTAFSLAARDPELLEKILRRLVPEIKLHTTSSERILYIPLRSTT